MAEQCGGLQGLFSIIWRISKDDDKEDKLRAMQLVPIKHLNCYFSKQVPFGFMSFPPKSLNLWSLAYLMASLQMYYRHLMFFSIFGGGLFNSTSQLSESDQQIHFLCTDLQAVIHRSPLLAEKGSLLYSDWHLLMKSLMELLLCIICRLNNIFILY